MGTSTPTTRLLKTHHDGMSTCQRPSVNSQWSVWYCIFALLLQIYIIVGSIQKFTKYVSLPWPPQGQPYFELNAYVAFLGAAVVLMPFFVITAIMKVGNHANDGYKIGEEEEDMVVYQNLKRKKYCRWLKALWKHGGPLAPLIHMAAALCLLFPKLLVEAQLIKHGFLAKSAIWRTDLDFVVRHEDRLVRLRFIPALNASEVWGEGTPLVTDPPVLAPEILNYAVALLVHAVRYPAVFWGTSKGYGLLFSFYALLTSIHQLLVFAGFSVLYKVHICGARDVLLRFSALFLNMELSILAFLAYNALLVVTTAVLYFYGLQKYREYADEKLQCQLIRWKRESRRFWGVAPHLASFAILLAMIMCAGPLTYDYALVYCGSLDGMVLAAVTSTVAHLFLWIVLWLILIVKHKWKFGRGSEGYQMGAFKGAGQEAPLLVIDHGQTYQVRERESRKAILDVVHRATLPKISPGDDEDIYWLKPKDTAPTKSPWHQRKSKSPGPKQKDKVVQEKKMRSLKKSPKGTGGKFKKKNFDDLSDSDDGDYATLRDMTVVREEGDGEDGLLNKRLHPKEVVRSDYENVEPFFPCSPEGFASPTPSHLRVPVAVHPAVSPAGSSESSPEKGTSESSSGVHSSASYNLKRASTSLENLAFAAQPSKSMSLQRDHVSFREPVPAKSMSLQRGVVPPNQRDKVFERATNVRMTSFTDHPDLNVVKSPSIIGHRHMPTHQRRDSANYSMASSAESESSVQH